MSLWSPDPGAVPSPETFRARELRLNMSGTERRVWHRLRGRRLAGYKFRRQLPIGPYFADFACLSAKLVVEVDGDMHEPDVDARKTAYVESQGFRVLRIPASLTDRHLEDVVETIWWALQDSAGGVDGPSPP